MVRPISQREVTEVVRPIVGQKIVEKVVTRREKRKTTSSSSRSWSSGESGEWQKGSAAAAVHGEADEALGSIF